MFPTPLQGPIRKPEAFFSCFPSILIGHFILLLSIRVVPGFGAVSHEITVSASPAAPRRLYLSIGIFLFMLLHSGARTFPLLIRFAFYIRQNPGLIHFEMHAGMIYGGHQMNNTIRCLSGGGITKGAEIMIARICRSLNIWY